MVPVPLSSWGGDLAGKHFSPDTGWDSTRCEPRTPRPGRRTAQAGGVSTLQRGAGMRSAWLQDGAPGSP